MIGHSTGFQEVNRFRLIDRVWNCLSKKSEIARVARDYRTVPGKLICAATDFSFWVCEKSDGVRVLVLIMSSLSGAHDIYLVSCS